MRGKKEWTATLIFRETKKIVFWDDNRIYVYKYKQFKYIYTYLGQDETRLDRTNGKNPHGMEHFCHS